MQSRYSDEASQALIAEAPPFVAASSANRARTNSVNRFKRSEASSVFVFSLVTGFFASTTGAFMYPSSAQIRWKTTKAGEEYRQNIT